MFGIGKNTGSAMGANGPEPGGQSGVATGLAAGTKVATSLGWRPVEAVVPGDQVLTFDNGMQTVTQVARAALWKKAEACPRHLWPLAVPAGALGNEQPMLLLPEQSVMLESDVGEEVYGDPFTLVPAAALDGFRGIHRLEPQGRIEAIVLQFERDQVVFGSAGALFFCPSARSLTVGDMLDDDAGDYLTLGFEDAAFLIGCIEAGGEADGLSASRVSHATFAA